MIYTPRKRTTRPTETALVEVLVAVQESEYGLLIKSDNPQRDQALLYGVMRKLPELKCSTKITDNHHIALVKKVS